MSKIVLVRHAEGRREIALMEGKRLLCFCRDEGGGIVAEQIYLGKVDRIVKGVEAAFVRLGGESIGFLPFSECREKPRSGDAVTVQVKKPPAGEKAAYLTEDIALAGRFALLTPFTRRYAVSRKITDEETRSRLYGLASRAAPAGMGLVMRTESADAGEDAVFADVEALKAAWEETLEQRAGRTEPGLLKGREDALLRLLRDEHGQIGEILTDRPEEIADAHVPVHACAAPFDLHNVSAKLEKSLARKVWLDCGGYLVVDPTEAMTVIDVNSGKFTGNKTGTENTFLKLNLEAAKEIARLLRLRGIGGIVIIDFVDMQDEASRGAVRQALEEALMDDPVKAVVHGFTSLGLVEMTRKKGQ
ncbi:MAG: ribonuclease E/G [Clostridia bacterium]|nr:ribonuclease E/G [Clostridia bacterium]